MLGISPFPKRGTLLPFGPLHVFCRVPTDEAGLFRVTAKRKLLSVAGPGLRGHAVIEAAKGKGLKMSKQTRSRYISLGNECAESSSPET